MRSNVLFHVEQGGRVRQRFQLRRNFGTGDEHLGASGREEGEHAALVRPVEFRGKVIQRYHWPVAPGFGVATRLRQQE